jgi:ABC-type nitrate/sulfonate/bicarbonate transport system substrate-binding protein
MITAPVYFRLEQQGYRSLANTSDYDDLYAPTVFMFKKTWAAANPQLVDALIKAHAEAIKRFYDDKAFALKAYLKFNNEDPTDLAKVYDRYAQSNTFERVPYVITPAVVYMIDHPVDAQLGAQLRAFDFHKVIDNSTVDRLVKQGFFEGLFGPAIKAEEASKAKLAYR